LVEGHIARRTGETYKFIGNIPFLTSLRKDGVISDDVVDGSGQLAQLTAVNAQYIVAHKQGLYHTQSAELRNWLPYASFYDDEQMTIYTTDPQLDVEYSWQDEVTDGVGWVQSRLLRNEDSATIRLTVDAIEPAKSGQYICLGSDVASVVCEPLPSFIGLHHVVYTLPTEAAFAPAYVYVVDEFNQPQREPARITILQPYQAGD